MFRFKIKMCTRVIAIFLVLSCAYGLDRKITSKNHPGCLECTDDDTLIYIRAEGSHDTIHQIWDFTGGDPTVILAVGSVNSTIQILWEGTSLREFNISENPKYTFATAFDKLFEYNDIHDNGYIDGNSKRRGVPLSSVTWKMADDIRTEEEVMVHMFGTIDHEDYAGTIEVRLDLLPFKDYAVQLPHLIHTANSTLMDISLVNLTSSMRYNSSRFALHTVLVSADSPNDTMHYAMRKSLDDEHTPGVFEIIEIKSPESFRNGDGGFLQFRPVAYTQAERGVESSTVVHVSPFNTSEIRCSTLDIFYREYSPAQLLIQDMLVSFGETGDGFYRKHNYTSWSLTVGYGSPPLEGFSAFVIAIICVGLGVPVLLAASGAAYACLRRRGPRPARFVDSE